MSPSNEPFHTGLQLDEGAVIGEAHHFSADAHADRIALCDGRPRIGHELLVAERHALGRRVVLQYGHIDLVVDLQHFRRMSDATP
jgi:hypothetical protein